MRFDVFVMQGEFSDMSNYAVSLTENQAELVKHLIRGRGLEEAGRLSGYATNAVYKAIKSPAVAAAVHEALTQDLMTIGAPAAYHVAKTLMMNESVSPRVRADISFKILDRAGFIVPSTKGKAPEKALSEMTQAELLAFIDRNQTAIDKAEGELAAAAKDVSAPTIAPNDKGLDAKSLNYLD